MPDPSAHHAYPKFKGIIFDFNGVLLWDAPLHVRAWQEIARRLRGTDLTETEFSEHVHGRPNSYILSYVTGRSLDTKELLDLTQAKESLYREFCLDASGSFILSPGAERLLDFVAAKGIPRTIATSSEKTNVDFFFRHLGLAEWFDLREVVHDDGVIPGKPAPDMYARAAASIGLSPRNCIVVEDAISGLKSAFDAGIGCIIGLGPRAMHPRLLACEGLFMAIEDLDQLPRQLIFPGEQ